MGSENGIDEGGLSETSLTYADVRCLTWYKASNTRSIVRLTHTNDIELETTFQKLLLDLRSNAIETDVAFRKNRLRLLRL